MKRWIAAALAVLLVVCGGALAGAEKEASDAGYLMADGWVYYCAPIGGESVYALCRARPEGGAPEVLLENEVGFHNLCAMDGWIYYAQPAATGPGGASDVRRVRLDGMGNELLGGLFDVQWLYAEGGELYIFDATANGVGSGAMLRYGVEPWALIARIELGDVDTGRFFVEGGYVYAVEAACTRCYGKGAPNRRFLRAPIDGSAVEPWLSIGSEELTAWSVADGVLTYALHNPGDAIFRLCRVNVDGGDPAQISTERVEAALIHGGWAYGRPIRRSASEPLTTVRIDLATGASEPMDVAIAPKHLHPAGAYLVYDAGDVPQLLTPDGVLVRALTAP